MSRLGLVLFIGRRLLVLCLLLILISFLVFLLLYASPSNAIDILLGTQPRSQATVQAIQHQYHLDEPFFIQYWLWASDALHLDFGNSITTTLPVRDEVAARLPTTIFLGIYAYILTVVLGVGLGIGAALRRRSAGDRAIVGGSIIALGTPVFVSGTFFIYFFAIVVHWFPTFGAGDGFVDELWHLTLPAVALALVGSAYLVKHTRAAMVNVLDQDYVTFARARGLSSRRILFMYALRNALIPVVTISGVLLAFTITGAVVVEVTFSLPGIGSLLVLSANGKDLPTVQGVALIVAAVIMLANLLADLLYIAVDPRIRLGRS